MTAEARIQLMAISSEDIKALQTATTTLNLRQTVGKIRLSRGPCPMTNITRKSKLKFYGWLTTVNMTVELPCHPNTVNRTNCTRRNESFSHGVVQKLKAAPWDRTEREPPRAPPESELRRHYELVHVSRVRWYISIVSVIWNCNKATFSARGKFISYNPEGTRYNMENSSHSPLIESHKATIHLSPLSFRKSVCWGARGSFWGATNFWCDQHKTLTHVRITVAIQLRGARDSRKSAILVIAIQIMVLQNRWPKWHRGNMTVGCGGHPHKIRGETPRRVHVFLCSRSRPKMTSRIRRFLPWFRSIVQSLFCRA